jgi:hypothetical protein
MKLLKILVEDLQPKIEFSQLSNKLQKELQEVYNREDIKVSVQQKTPKDKVRGVVKFNTRLPLEATEFQNIKTFLETKGYNVTKSESTFNPHIIFEFAPEQDILPEGEDEKTMELSDLTWDGLISIFGRKPYFGFNFPSPKSDTENVINDEDRLEMWKKRVSTEYGNVHIKVDTDTHKIKVLDDKFNADREKFTSGKAAWLDKERQAGRTSGLD